MKRGKEHDIKDSISAAVLKKELVHKNKYLIEESNVITENEKKAANDEKSVFQDLSNLKKHHQVLFSLIIITAVVLVVRGIWNLADRYWFPLIPDFSDASGIIIGIVILLIMKKVINDLAK